MRALGRRWFLVHSSVSVVRAVLAAPPDPVVRSETERCRRLAARVNASKTLTKRLQRVRPTELSPGAQKTRARLLSHPRTAWMRLPPEERYRLGTLDRKLGNHYSAFLKTAKRRSTARSHTKPGLQCEMG